RQLAPAGSWDGLLPEASHKRWSQVGSADAVQRDHGDDAGGLGGVLPELGSLLGVMVPQPIALLTAGDVGTHGEGFAAGFHLGLGIGEEVEVPLRMLRGAALAGGDTVPIAA